MISALCFSSINKPFISINFSTHNIFLWLVKTKKEEHSVSYSLFIAYIFLNQNT